MSSSEKNSGKNVNLTINGVAVSVPQGTRILEAAEKADVHIPTLSDFEGQNKLSLGRRAVCRICVVECDGRSKLIPACANEVWEGVNIVTNNRHVLSVRKTIVELLLADHPEDCLSCIRSGTCELQKIAADFGIREKPFHRKHKKRQMPEPRDGILIRNMDKCVKCGRCIEACQEIQTVRAINSAYRSVNYTIGTPFGEGLDEGPCIGCGLCAEVCPVAAIHESDQTALVWELLNKKEKSPVTQVAASLCRALADEFANGEFYKSAGKPRESISPGKIAAALKQLGFEKVYDAEKAAKISMAEQAEELSGRIKNKGPLPMIAACSPAVDRFVKEFYPELRAHLSAGKSPEQTLGSFVKAGPGASKLSYVSLMPCIAKKQGSALETVDIALTARELAGMFRLAGINFANMPEIPFDDFPQGKTAGEPDSTWETALSGIYSAYTGDSGPVNGDNAVVEVNSLADARKVFDSIRRGECTAALVLVKNCSCAG